MVYFNIETLNCSTNPPSLNSFKKICAAMATFKNLLKMTVLGERLNKTDMEKVGWKFWAMYQCMLNIPLWNERCKVTYSEVLVLQCSKLFCYKVSSEPLRQDSQSTCSLGIIQNVGETELCEEKKIVFHWRKISSKMSIMSLELGRIYDKI